jgi:hypothetical protein
MNLRLALSPGGTSKMVISGYSYETDGPGPFFQKFQVSSLAFAGGLKI